MNGTTPPGWYNDGRALRWWDGIAWGPYAPPPPVDMVTTGKGVWWRYPISIRFVRP